MSAGLTILLVVLLMSVQTVVIVLALRRFTKKRSDTSDTDEIVAVNDLNARMAQLQTMKFAPRPHIVRRKMVD